MNNLSIKFDDSSIIVVNNEKSYICNLENIAKISFLYPDKTSDNIGNKRIDDGDLNCSFYSIDGIMLQSGNRSSIRFKNLPKGFYIVKSSIGTRKVIVR